MISRGSEWRKWNLHMHSEYSRENRTKMKITEIFDSAVKNNISMISITDHSNFDALDEIWDIYQNGMCEQGHYSDIVDFLPGIELKTDKGKKGVHIISIFPKEIVVNRNTKQATKSVLYDNFCTKLGLSYSEIESNGDGDYAKGLLCSIVDFDRAVNLTHELGGVVIIHGGDKHGSIEEEMAHANSKEPTPEELYESLDITKTEIISSKIDIIELPNFERRQAKNAHFYNSVFLKPCMVASDAHEKSEYDVLGEKITWVKADTTFEGFKQSIIDYENRMCLKEIPEQLERIKKNPTKYIKELEINWSDGYAGEKGDWFKNIKIPLNSGLVSVIGNKGNGKSAIAEIIGWLSDSKNYTKFAFLNSKKFLKNRLANNFTAKITWIDNQVSMKENLGAQPDLNNVERVQCIPQQYFEEICTDTELEKFTTEINGVIFSRLSEEDKEGARSFEELIDKYTRISEQNISLMQTNLSEVNRDIISLESKLSREYKTKQEALLQDAQNQLLAQINICPQEVKKPELPQEVQEQYDKVIEEIGNIENEIEKKQEEILEVNSVSKKVQHILEYIDEVENRINKEIEQITLQVEDFDIKVEEVIKFTVDKSPIISKKEIIDKKLSELKETVEDEQNGLKVQLKQKISVKESIVAEENRNIQLYDAYIKEYQEWEKVKKEKEEAVNKINEELLYISDGIMIDLQPLYEKRQNITASIFNEKKKVIELYNKFKKPVDEFLRDKADLLSEYSISIRSGLVINEMFQEEVFSYINKQKKNAFRDDNYQLTKTVDALAEMDDIEQYIAIPNKIIKKMKDYDNENIVSSQLKDNKWLEFYNYLFGLQYIQNKYELVSDNKTLEKLSPGERGALLLIFYLLLDLRDIPLVIDQPEDNLDNQSVASILVSFIQAAKKRRQIILVTHNPNLAVVADSDQIVHVKINKEERNLVEVKSGGIENTEINDSIVTILEGTMLSFRKRDEKYIDK